MSRMSTVVSVLAASVALASGCGGAEQTDSVPPAPPQAASPPNPAVNGLGALAANAVETNTITSGGQDELDRRIDALRGNPIVVNRWASWCAPCREELPFFNDSARAHQDEIAFIGLNTLDNRAAAERFLTEVPFPGPSVEDRDGALAIGLGIGSVSPGTAFINKTGEVVATRPGAYANRQELEADIRRYLLRG